MNTIDESMIRNNEMDDIPVERIREFETGLYKYADLHDEVLKAIDIKKDLDEEIEALMKILISDYKITVDYLDK